MRGCWRTVTSTGTRPRIPRSSCCTGSKARARLTTCEAWRQGLGGGVQRRAAQPAELRRHRAPVGDALSLGPHGRRRHPAPAARSRRAPADRRRRLFAWRQSRAQAGWRLRHRASGVAPRRGCSLAGDGSAPLRGRARADEQPDLPVELRAEPEGAHAAEGGGVPGVVLDRSAGADPDRPRSSTKRIRPRSSASRMRPTTTIAPRPCAWSIGSVCRR